MPMLFFVFDDLNLAAPFQFLVRDDRIYHLYGNRIERRVRNGWSSRSFSLRTLGASIFFADQGVDIAFARDWDGIDQIRCDQELIEQKGVCERLLMRM